MSTKSHIKISLLLMFLAITSFVACTSDKTTEEETNDGETSGIVATSSEVTERESTADAPSEDATSSTSRTVDTENAAVEKSFAKMTFTEEEYDFGTIKEGEIVKHTFAFRNTGDVPLIIKNASASCGCTVPDWPKEPIAPGAKSRIEVQFNSKNKTGNINKTVSIQANTDPPLTTLQIKGTVNQVLDMKGPLKQ